MNESMKGALAFALLVSFVMGIGVGVVWGPKRIEYRRVEVPVRVEDENGKAVSFNIRVPGYREVHCATDARGLYMCGGAGEDGGKEPMPKFNALKGKLEVEYGK